MRHTHLQNGIWDGLSDEEIAKNHPKCLACRDGIPNDGNSPFTRLPYQHMIDKAIEEGKK